MKKKINIDLGKKLFIFRENLNMTQKEFAKLTGVGQTGYGKAERGEVNPQKYIDKLADSLNIDKTDIEQGKEGQVVNNYGNIEILGNVENVYKLDNLSLPEIKKVLEQVIKSIEQIEKKEVVK
jgi:transcriptional regulator with XRE-family HTH domain